MSDEFRLIGIGSNSQMLFRNNRHVVFNKRNVVLVLAEVSLALLCIIGDYYIFDTDKLIKLVNRVVGLSERLVRAMMDNASHSLVAQASWFIATYPNRFNLVEMIACGLIASLLDLDHFISAGSTRLVDAVSLSQRPFAHNSLTWLLVNLGLYAGLVYASPDKQHWAWLVFIAWFSHHVRDANRRGLWWGSLYTTKPLSDTIYITTILLIPLLLRYVIGRMSLKLPLTSSSTYRTTESIV